MKVVTNNDNFTIFIPKEIEIYKETIKTYIKDLIIKLKQKYKLKISGFYKANIYKNKKILIMEFIKEDDLDFFKDIVDLDVNIHENEDIYLEFKDIFIINKFDKIYYYKNNYYLKMDYISNKDFPSIVEHSTYIYGEKLERIKNKLKLVVKNI